MPDENKKVDTSHVPAWAKDIGRNVSKSQLVGLDGKVLSEGAPAEWEKHLTAAFGDAGKKHIDQLKNFDMPETDKLRMVFGILRVEAPAYYETHQAEDPRLQGRSGIGSR